MATSGDGIRGGKERLGGGPWRARSCLAGSFKSGAKSLARLSPKRPVRSLIKKTGLPRRRSGGRAIVTVSIEPLDILAEKIKRVGSRGPGHTNPPGPGRERLLLPVL